MRHAACFSLAAAARNATAWLRTAALVAIFAGCAAPPPIERGSQAFTIEVRDAETRAPIADAKIAVRTTIDWLARPFDPYAIDCIERNPGLAEARTDAHGLAVVHAVTLDRPYRFGWRIAAPGYLSSQLLAQPELPAGTNEHLVPRWDRSRPAAAPYVYWMYREPAPQVELVLPAGLRGPVLITTVQSSSFVQGAAGHRRFSYTVPASGILQVAVAPLLAHGPFNAYIERVHYDNGQDVPSEPRHAVDDKHASEWAIKDAQLVALRLVRRFAPVEPTTTHLGREVRVTRWLYVVGTRADAEAIAARLGPREPTPPPDDATILRLARGSGAS